MKSVNTVQFSTAIAQVGNPWLWRKEMQVEGKSSTLLAVKQLVLSICPQLEKELSSAHLFKESDSLQYFQFNIN